MKNSDSINVFFTVAKLIATAGVTVLYFHYFSRQSWGFYTTKPNVPLYDIYRVHNGVIDKSPIIKNSISYGMGISWKGKILYNELLNITKKKLSWKLLNEDSLIYITQFNNYILFSKVSENANFKGTFLITKTDRPSYFVLKNGKRFNPSKQYILADIR